RGHTLAGSPSISTIVRDPHQSTVRPSAVVHSAVPAEATLSDLCRGLSPRRKHSKILDQNDDGNNAAGRPENYYHLNNGGVGQNNRRDEMADMYRIAHEGLFIHGEAT
ncbi:unnamed protein product, partial [Amoebophrya sp. A25]